MHSKHCCCFHLQHLESPGIHLPAGTKQPFYNCCAVGKLFQADGVHICSCRHLCLDSFLVTLADGVISVVHNNVSIVIPMSTFSWVVDVWHAWGLSGGWDEVAEVLFGTDQGGEDEEWVHQRDSKESRLRFGQMLRRDSEGMLRVGTKDGPRGDLWMP